MRIALVALTLLRLWLPTAQYVRGVGGAMHDDRLFLYQAEHILQGWWLGPYGYTTLAKSPMFSIFAAGAYALHVPLPLAEDLAWVAACIAITLALRPLVTKRWMTFALYVVLLFNPMSYDSTWMARIVRSSLCSSLALLTIAAFAGIATYRRSPRAARLGWTALFGLSLGSFWITREESIWIVPVLGLLLSGIVLSHWRVDRSSLRSIVSLQLGGVAIAVALTTAVASVSYAHYGVFVISDQKSPEFEAAYGAMSRVEPQQRKRFVPVTRAARERIYAVSPAFAELKPFLEGDLGHFWASESAPWIGESADELELGGGWMLWALRAAVQESGHYESAPEAAAYYRRIAGEINDACERGALRCGPPRATLAPILGRDDVGPIARDFARALRYLSTFELFSAIPYSSLGDAESLEIFGRMTRAKVAPSAPSIVAIEVTRSEKAMLSVLGAIGVAYQWINPLVVIGAVVGWIAAMLRSIRARRVTVLFTVATAALVAMVEGAFLVALIEATSFPAINSAYLAPFFPMMLLFAWSVAGELVTGRE